MSLLLLFSLAASQNPENSVPEQRRERTSDPVSSLFSELGNLILDVDQTIAVQSQPKIEHEANVMSQLFRPQSDYFNRIQNNYKEMQKRLGKLIGNTIGFRNTYSDHELSTVSPPPENFNPTIGPDYNPFAVAAEARKEKLKQRISEGSYEPKSSIPKTIDESLKAFGKLSQAIIDDIGNFPIEGKSSKSVGDKKLSPKRTGDIEECSNEVLEDPDLEKRRQERCSQIAAAERARESLRKMMKEQKRATEALLSKSTDVFDKITKDILGRSGDTWVENDSKEGSVDLKEECDNEVLEDPDLEKRRQERCSQIATEERLRENLRKMMKEQKRATEALFSKSVDTFDKLTKDILGRSGDLRIESDVAESTDETNSEMHGDVSDDCPGDVLEDVSLENARKEKCARVAAEERFLKDLNKLLKEQSQKWAPVGTKAIDDLSTFIRRSGEPEDKSSESSSDLSLDKQITQLIKDHGSWILDYPLIKRWRQRDRSGDSATSEQSSEDALHSTDSSDEVEPTEFYLPVSTDYDMAVQKSGDVVSVSPHESSYYRIVNQDGEILEEDIDFVLHPESLSNDIDDIEEMEPKETVILAFTSDGVPLKLRVGPEIDNPIQYLHKVLQSAGVSLNIPVESYDDLEPVGKEVLKLGSGILTRAVLIDASNQNELKSLLKALMVSKTTGKTNF